MPDDCPGELFDRRRVFSDFVRSLLSVDLSGRSKSSRDHSQPAPQRENSESEKRDNRLNLIRWIKTDAWILCWINIGCFEFRVLLFRTGGWWTERDTYWSRKEVRVSKTFYPEMTMTSGHMKSISCGKLTRNILIGTVIIQSYRYWITLLTHTHSSIIKWVVSPLSLLLCN
jgi:hypothetical protein